jgi:putative membrane protein
MEILKVMFKRSALGLATAGLLVVGAAAQSGSAGSSSAGGSSDPTMQGQSSGSSQVQGSSGSTSSQLSSSDRKFVEKAAAGGLAEVELGQLATEKASSDEVKKFGQRMVDDHSKANDQLKQLASSKGIQLPQDLEAKDKAIKERLSKLSGEQFDHAYMSDMVKDHTKDVSEFRKESNAGKDPELKSFAAQTLPTLQEHLKQAQSIAPKEKSEAKQQTSSMQSGSPQQ